MNESKTLLTIDIGNTALKASVFEGEKQVTSIVGSGGDAEAVRTLLALYSVDGIVCCRVGEDRDNVVATLKQEDVVPVLEIGGDTRVPISVDYDRSTLGNDRLAAAVGVAQPGVCRLLVDAGTAMTLDLTRGMRYCGGNIAPGPRLRLESLNRFTAALPLVEIDGKAPLFGHNTQEAIRSGVVRGMAYEVAQTLRSVHEFEPDAELVITGGYARILSRHLMLLGVKHTIDHDAVGRGMVRIFNYNNDTHE